MGFYSPQTLVADARRHGVVVRGPDLNASAAGPTLEREDPSGEPPVASVADDWSDLMVATGFAVRLGLSSSGRSGPTWPSGSRPAGPTGTWPTWPAAPS